MTGSELRHIVDRFGTSQRGLAQQLGVNERTVRHWIAGDSPIPRSIEILIDLLAKQKDVAETNP